MESIAVVDYGMGNLRSVAKALQHVTSVAQKVTVTSDAQVIADAQRVVFPGQGAIRDCMGEIDKHGLRDSIIEATQRGPFLGICMGLQALMDNSEEDRDTRGLGLVSGGVARFPVACEVDQKRLKIPHMGWNNVHFTVSHPLWNGIVDGARFYFVHSYYVAPDDQQLIAARTEYGVNFVCAIAYEKVFAVQFHPEKSQHAGLQLLRNFLCWQPE